jgi:hypothetical protein
MRTQGSPSWQFGHDLDQSLHLVLFVRDALGLEVDGDPISPPRLAGPVVDHRLLLDPGPTGAVVSQWSWWWQSVVGLQAPARPGPPSGSGDRRAWYDEFAAQRRTVLDPPTWSCLDDRPALQDAVRAVSGQGFSWFTAARGPHVTTTRTDVFPWEQVRLGAERAAAEHGVSLDAINGRAQVLMVEGSWWRLVAPGAALCSVAAAHDADTIAAILDAVFSSNLAA